MYKMLLAIAAVIACSGGARAQAWDPNYPVCLQVYGPTSHISCRFTSIEQCKFSASGRAAECVVNPYYAADGSEQRRYRRYRPY